MRGIERPVIRQVVSVACGPEQSGTPHDVATQTRRAFCIGSSCSSEGESGAAITEGPMETGGSSVEAVVGAADPSEIQFLTDRQHPLRLPHLSLQSPLDLQ